jgi:hypothetical protein
MIIGNLNTVRAQCLPDKTYTPLLIDANTVLPFAIVRQLFELKSRAFQVGERRRGIQLEKAADSDFFKYNKLWNPLLIEYCFRLVIVNAANHS